jgi:hypothetical protein
MGGAMEFTDDDKSNIEFAINFVLDSLSDDIDAGARNLIDRMVEFEKLIEKVRKM